MTTRAEEGRAAASAAMTRLAARWRGRSMPDDVQREFDAHARDRDAFEVEIAEAAAAEEVAVAERQRAAPAPAPLAAKFTAIRDITTDAERATAVADMQELAAEHRGYRMPVEAQRAFDMLVHAIDGFDADCAARADAPPDPRDAVLAEMRARVSGPPVRPSATPPLQTSLLAQGAALLRSRYF